MDFSFGEQASQGTAGVVELELEQGHATRRVVCNLRCFNANYLPGRNLKASLPITTRIRFNLFARDSQMDISITLLFKLFMTCQIA